MAFIDELLKNGLPYGMEIEQPKAHDEINRLVIDDDIQRIIKGLVMGTMGGGAGIPIKKLLKDVGLYTRALKLPGAHYKNLQKMDKLVKDITKRNKTSVENVELIKRLEKITEKNKVATKSLAEWRKRTKLGTSSPSFDIGGWKNVKADRVPVKEGSGGGKAGLIGLLGLLGLLGKGPDMSGAGDMPIGQTDLLPKYADPNYYEGETSSMMEEEDLNEFLKIIQETKVGSKMNYPFHFSKSAPSWVK
jgi:hypothetical protein